LIPAVRFLYTSRSLARCAERLRTARRSLVSGFLRQGTSQRCSESTRTRCFVRCTPSETRDYSNSLAGAACRLLVLLHSAVRLSRRLESSSSSPAISAIGQRSCCRSSSGCHRCRGESPRALQCRSVDRRGASSSTKATLRTWPPRARRRGGHGDLGHRSRRTGDKTGIVAHTAWIVRASTAARDDEKTGGSSHLPRGPALRRPIGLGALRPRHRAARQDHCRLDIGHRALGRRGARASAAAGNLRP